MQPRGKKWKALYDEAALAAEHLCIGATALGKASYSKQAYYYEAFFALSVGLERSFKLILTVDKFNDDGEFYDKEALQRLGHDLQGLIKIIEQKTDPDLLPLYEPPSTSINNSILEILSDFAKNVTRYYNLEFIANETDVENPVSAWYRLVSEPIFQMHTSKKQKDQISKAGRAGQYLGKYVQTQYQDEQGNSITDYGRMLVLDNQAAVIQRWTRMYVLQFARYIAKHMRRLSDGEFPFIYEHYHRFNVKDSCFRNRKNWTIFS